MCSSESSRDGERQTRSIDEPLAFLSFIVLFGLCLVHPGMTTFRLFMVWIQASLYPLVCVTYMFLQPIIDRKGWISLKHLELLFLSFVFHRRCHSLPFGLVPRVSPLTLSLSWTGVSFQVCFPLYHGFSAVNGGRLRRSTECDAARCSSFQTLVALTFEESRWR